MRPPFPSWQSGYRNTETSRKLHMKSRRNVLSYLRMRLQAQGKPQTASYPSFWSWNSLRKDGEAIFPSLDGFKIDLNSSSQGTRNNGMRFITSLSKVITIMWGNIVMVTSKYVVACFVSISKRFRSAWNSFWLKLSVRSQARGWGEMKLMSTWNLLVLHVSRNIFSYEVHLWNLRRGSVSVSKSCSLIDDHFISHTKETGSLRSYRKIWRRLISCWTDLTPWNWYIAMMFTLTKQQI